MSLLRAAVTVLATAALGLPGAGAAHAAESGTDPSTRAPIPVGYHFLSGASLAITEPGAPLPGANDWTCRPTADKPRPVVLVHGTLGSGTSNWATYGPLLHNEGYCVYTLTYGATPGAQWPLSELGGVSDIRAVSLPQVAQFVDRVLEATGAEQVDMVGHSQGTLISGLVAKTERPGRVHTVASLAPLWRGTGGSVADQMLTASSGGERDALERGPSRRSFPARSSCRSCGPAGPPTRRGCGTSTWRPGTTRPSCRIPLVWSPGR